MKQDLLTPRYTMNTIRAIFNRMYSQIGEIDAKTGKPILNSKTVKKLHALQLLFDVIDSGKTPTATLQMTTLNTCLHTSTNMTAKLEDINALSTACSANPVCKARATDCNSICAHCFAFLTFDRYNDLEQAAIINFILLNAMVYSVAAWKMVSIPASNCGLMFRIEAFGDVGSAVQAANYIRLAATHRHLGKIGIWSKNLGFWHTAFSAYGKPSNIVFNASSPVLNQPMTIDPRFTWFVDHVFTVYSCTGALDGNVNINCGDRKCKNCRRCYSKGNEQAVNEILKQESKRYYKAIGKEFSGRQ